MVVTVITVGMVQAAADQVIDVLAVRDPRMPAVCAMGVALIMAAGVRSATVRMRCIDFEEMLVNVVGVRVMQMPVV